MEEKYYKNIIEKSYNVCDKEFLVNRKFCKESRGEFLTQKEFDNINNPLKVKEEIVSFKVNTEQVKKSLLNDKGTRKAAKNKHNKLLKQKKKNSKKILELAQKMTFEDKKSNEKDINLDKHQTSSDEVENKDK